MKKLIFIALIAGGIYLATKVKTNFSALNNISAKIKSIKNVSFSDGFINLKLDLNLTNLSNYNLGIDTFSFLSVRQLRFYNAQNRLLIGAANVNISNIELPSKKTLVLADIVAKIPTNNLLSHISLFNGDTANNLKIVPVFNVAGKDFEINPEKFV